MEKPPSNTVAKTASNSTLESVWKAYETLWTDNIMEVVRNVGLTYEDANDRLNEKR